jgi:hypothetical protein
VSKLNRFETRVLLDALTDYLVAHLDTMAGEQTTRVLCGAFAAALGKRLAPKGVRVDAVSVRFEGAGE